MAIRSHAWQAVWREEEEVDPDEIDDGIWSVVCDDTTLGRIDRQTGKITGNEKV